ncbi:hypothetical protein ACERJO_04305 [Halalkalibacter sp. AB-rgal2]|uniref:hypothetical protein n=1 Tax=Halalkalibacter sp. AB-rgal2 TaxID=3242695 RepID=UPI00359DE451
MFNQFVLWTLFLAPWVLLIFINQQVVKRYLPAALFGALIITIVFQIADNFNWWVIKENIFILNVVTPFVYGAFLVGTVIILALTFQRFWLFIMVNLVIDAILSFVISPWFERIGLYQLQEMNAWGVYALTTIIAIFIYVYQKWQSSVFQ